MGFSLSSFFLFSQSFFDTHTHKPTTHHHTPYAKERERRERDGERERRRHACTRIYTISSAKLVYTPLSLSVFMKSDAMIERPISSQGVGAT